MIYPSAVDCLKSVEYTLKHKIGPSLTGSMERSELASAGHLLRHVICRIESEGEVLSEDIRSLRRLLTDIKTYAASLAYGSPALARSIEEVLHRRFRPADSYPSLTSLAEEAGALREALAAAQQWLIDKSGDLKDKADYLEIRERIRAYIAQQLTAEASLIEPAFIGHGPRR